MPTPRKTPSSGQSAEPRVLVVPRSWLIVLTVLVVAPWVVVGTLYWLSPAGRRGEGRPAPPVAVADDRPAGKTTDGRWGKLDITTIVISPPLELVGHEWQRPAGAGKHWFFPDTAPAEAASFLASIGLEPDRVTALMSTSQREASINGIVFTPSPDLVRSLSPEVRERLYVQLAKSRLNEDQVQAFRFADTSVEAWLGPTLISPATRRFVEPLIFRHGRHLYFADPELVQTGITDPDERRRLAKALLRQTTSRVRLEITSESQVPGLVEYWGRGGRRTDIRPLLESIAEGDPGDSIDIVHLLPSFARSRLYRFPLMTAKDLNRPALANCLWTSLNFFKDQPDDRFLDAQVAVEYLQREYFLIDNQFELGDVVALVDERGVIYHTAVFMADDLVFTKNGTSPMAPWVILPLETLVDYYRIRCENPRLLYHRQKDF